MNSKSAPERVEEKITGYLDLISHDLYVPLSVIIQYAELLQKEFSSNLPEEGKHYLERIGVVSHRMEKSLVGLLDSIKRGRQDNRCPKRRRKR